jgi:hypothetical protein
VALTHAKRLGPPTAGEKQLASETVMRGPLHDIEIGFDQGDCLCEFGCKAW